jgi:hypothetical protein
MSPTPRNGKICYIEVPATDVQRSSAFYSRVFGWALRTRSDGTTAFDDTTGEVSGSFITGRPVSDGTALMIYVMVDDLDAAGGAIEAHGGAVVYRAPAESPVRYAKFRDPAGNIMGIYQER